jgi:hypothetical protein
MRKQIGRFLPYFVIIVLIFVGIVAINDSINRPIEFNHEQPFVTRSAVDSTQVKAYEQRVEQPQQPKKEIPWTEITAAIVSLSVGFGSIGFKASHTKINGRLDNIDVTLQSVIDQRNKDNVDHALIKIEQDAASLVDDDKIKALIEGIGSRTRSFTRDVINCKFDEVALEKADLKIGARSQDCKHQVHDLQFSNYFETEINKIRSARTKQLHTDLARLMKDRVHNSKYERFGDLICRFQSGFMKEVVKLYYESKG